MKQTLSGLRVFSRTIRVGAIAGLLALAACDAGGDDPASGRFDVRVSGAIEDRHEGLALFGTINKDGVDVFGLQLQSAEERPHALISLDRGAVGVPAEGTYPVVGSLSGLQEPGGAFAAVYTLSQQDPFFFDTFPATGGEVTITASDERRVAGRVTFTADGGGGRLIEVEGTFDALHGH